jgi:flagellar biosynthesis component FlhA
MAETETKKKKRKRQQTIVLSEQQEEESQSLAELVRVLEELEKEGKVVEIQVCPRCKSPKVRRVKTMSGDLWSHMGWLPPKFECEECGWRAHLVLKATNKRLSVKDVEIIAEALDSENQ